MATADGPDGSVDLPQFDRDEHCHDYGTLGENWYWQGGGNDEEREFEWKTRRGPSGDTGDVWERGSNHGRTDLHPSHQGWADE
ncbi:hypothetical protein [Natrialba asiatica]|uniref:Glycosidase n=1 Tax=Natrialba asiatica (strain ATCC 700177 / DSM 12278 / JCM 9576 / FERM P-10747 / NBRC 102637 / 172P1) TaxID=29540 RepID=M0ALB5_NATA1|nr:hypothetical protein [Natrialba asiatica]ELY99490.1 glycosidase [Natrialba asiatica DSM 12278]